MKTFNIRTSDGGIHNIVADGFMVSSDGSLEVVKFTEDDAHDTISRVVALYAQGFWQSIREAK
jgi:hypothetical protein